MLILRNFGSDIIKKVPLSDSVFFAALFFLVGIALASFKASVHSVFGFIIVAILFLFWRQRRRSDYLSYETDIIKRRRLLGLTAFLPILIFIGFFYFYFFEAWHQEKIIFNQPIKITGVIVEDPKISLKKQEFFVELQPPFKGRARVYAPVQPSYQYGDFIELKGKIEKSERGLNQIFFPQIQLVEEGGGNGLRFKLFNLKAKLIANLNKALPPSSAALASGMIFGDRSRFLPEFEDKLIRTGMIHLTVLSGSNITIMVNALQNLLAYLMSKRKSFYLTFFFILFFVLMTGSQPSTVRAALIGGLAAVGQRWSRLYNPRNVIVLTAFIMVLFNPRLLIFDLSFQLSFLAFIGIVYFGPFFSKFIKKDGAVDNSFLNWRNNAVITLSAQAAVLPLLLLTFGQFSWFSVLPNVLILPFVPTTIFGGFLTAVIGFISQPLSMFGGSILNLLLSYEMGVINFFAAYF